jgi:hypothetical protein
MILKRGLIGSVGMALMMTASAQAADDEKRGEQVFNQAVPLARGGQERGWLLTFVNSPKCSWE